MAAQFDGDYLVPAEMRAAAAEEAARVPAELAALMGGCWNLALHERTGFPIEVFDRDGAPTRRRTHT